SRALNAGWGRSRRSWARLANSASSASGGGTERRGAARIASSDSANRSIRASSVMEVPHPGPQCLERAELQLLDRAVGASQLAGDLAYALLLDEALPHDPLLIVGEAADKVGEQRPSVDGGRTLGRILTRILTQVRLTTLACRALPPIGYDVPGDLEEPRRE